MTESGMEPAHGLTQMLQHAGRKKGTAQIKRARQRVIDGQDHWKALSIEGVLTKREADAMHSATSSETQTWLLRQMATAHANRVSTWSVTRFRVFTGIAQILFGLLVLLFCVGLFRLSGPRPLVHLLIR